MRIGISFIETGGIDGVGLVIGKFVGAKIASFLGPKFLGIVEAKTAAIIAGKIASAFEFILAPLIDYFANEAIKESQWNETKYSFEQIIDKVFADITKNIIQNLDMGLITIKNNVYNELNKQVVIKAKIKQ